MPFGAILIALSLTSPSAPQPRTLEPTPLEAAVAQDGARLTWTKFAGRLESRVASAIVTAIAVETPGTAKIMRGVRIELRHEGNRPASCNLIDVEWAILCARDNAALYIEESQLTEVRNAVLRCCASIHKGHGAGITTFGPTSRGDAGLLIGGYTFDGRQPSELASLLDAAAALLADAPR